VLLKTHEVDPKLTVLVAILGLIYTTIRGIAMGQFLAFSPTLLSIAKSLDQLKRHVLGKQLASEDYVAAEAQLKRVQVSVFIQGLFLSVISLFCLFALLTALMP
jgi:hypothetical protein